MPDPATWRTGLACPGCGQEYESSGYCSCGYEKRLRRFEQRNEPQSAAQDLDEFRRKLLVVVEPKLRKEDSLEDWPKRFLAPLAWLGTQTLERAAPQDRQRIAEEFIHSIGARAELAKVPDPRKSKRWRVGFDQRRGLPTAQIYRPHGFLERELARLPSHAFPGNQQKEFLLLCRLHQGRFEEHLAKHLQAVIRKIGQKEADAAAHVPPSGASAPEESHDSPGAEPPTAKSSGEGHGKKQTNAERIHSRAAARRAVVEPLLLEKGWSHWDWASESNVDHHTVNHYLSGATKKLYPSTRLKLAKSLGLNVKSLPV
jgi:hypothetical protein